MAGYVAYAPQGGEALFDGMLAAGTGIGAGRWVDRRCHGRGRLRRGLLHAATSLLAAGYGVGCAW